MDKKYTVLKKFGDLKKGEIFDPVAMKYAGTEKDIAEAVEKKFIAEIVSAPTHEELVAKATELDVDFDDTTTDEELTALIEAKSQHAPTPSKGKKDSVTVTWNGGVREYSRAIHGDDFEELAKSLANQYPEAIIA